MNKSLIICMCIGCYILGVFSWPLFIAKDQELDTEQLILQSNMYTLDRVRANFHLEIIDTGRSSIESYFLASCQRIKDLKIEAKELGEAVSILADPITYSNDVTARFSETAKLLNVDSCF